MVCRLIADVCHLQGIIISVILLSQIHAQMTQDISHIPSGRMRFFLCPCSHLSPFNQNRRNPKLRRIIIAAAACHTGTHHIGHICLLRHLSGCLYHPGLCYTCVIYIRCQLLIAVTAVQINIKIHSRKQFLFNGIGQPLHLAARFFSGKYPV